MIIKDLGIQPYLPILKKMQHFTKSRSTTTEDEIWCLQHNPIFTLGQAGKQEHVLNPGSIPVVQSDRGGQVTYHGPGQLICYLLLDLKKININIKQLVTNLEQSVVSLLSHYKIISHCLEKAPGVYIDNKKICSVGLRIKKGYCYHGISLNINLDLEPFSRINPCGYHDLKVTKITDYICLDFYKVQQDLLEILKLKFSF